ncbi:TonB-dependent receptor domain-containing protein [Caenispirillum bisanense]|uniref:TonB-dependent receptor domain-containing protein n=1 Tax=Caenispirillum bisanense TaxID=414052 RepID=UPI0031DA8D81
MKDVSGKGGAGRLSILVTTTALVSAAAAGAASAQQAGTTATAADTPVSLRPIAIEDTRPEPAGTIQLTPEDIEREQPQTLRDLFRDQPAVTISSGSVASQKLYVHGIAQNKLNVTIDGAQQRNNVWHHNGNLFLDPGLLKSVAVNPGVAPADAGPAALGGAVAFETKDAADLLLPGRSYGGRLTTSYDTNSETARATAAGFAAVQGFDLLGMVTRADGNDYENGAGITERGTGTDLLNGLAKLRYEAPSGHRVKVSAEYLNDDTVRRLRPNMGFVTNELNRNDLTRTTFTAAYETTAPTPLFDPKVSVYYNLYDLKRPNESGYTRPSGDFNSQVETIGGKLQNTVLIPMGNLTVGADFSHDDISIERFHFATDVGEEITTAGLFAQARVSPVDRLTVSTGLRGDVQRYEAVDGQTFENAGLSPNISADYGLTDWLTVFGGYSYVWGGLEPSETALFHARNYTYADDLEPVTSHNVRVGARTEYEGFGFEAAYFHTLMHNPMEYNYTTSRRINGPDLESRGVDLIASYRTETAGVSAKYTHTDITYGDRIALPGDYYQGTAIGDLITLSGHYTFTPIGLTVGASTEIALDFKHDDLRANGYADVDGYTVVDLFVEWAPPSLAPYLTLRAEANNVFDETYYSRSTYSQTARVTPVYDPGRSFLVSSVIRF